jgi:CSLREA domain-containing protein
MKIIAKSLIGIVLVVILSQFVSGATFTVTKTADTADGVCDADCSLREAVVAANATVDNDIIVFSSLFNSPQTITLSGTDIIITNNGTLSINGPGPNNLTVRANALSRVFTNNTGSNVTISNLRVNSGNGVSTVASGRGGGIYNTAAILTLNNLVIDGNSGANGGALSNAGTSTMNIVNCAIFANSATGSGGAIQNFSGNNFLNISNSSIYGNTSGSNTVGGGAIQANGNVSIVNSTFANNRANTGSGGAIFYNGSVLNVTNSTFAGNTSALNGGGIHATAITTNIRNTIISGNSGVATSPDATGSFNSLGNNLIGNVGVSVGWIATDLQNTNPVLSPFGFYGGNGLSYALLSSSPAQNAGQNCVTDLTCPTNNPAAALTTDQRGASRPSNSTVDIGAFESSNVYRAMLPDGVVNVAYNQTLSPSAGGSTFTLSTGLLPSGLAVTSPLFDKFGTTSALIAGTPILSGVFDFSLSVTTGANSAVVNYRITVPVSNAVGSISGRVLDSSGNAVGRTWITATDDSGNIYNVRSNPFGYYRLVGLPAGRSYTVEARTKVLVFQNNPRIKIISSDLTNEDFVATNSNLNLKL